MIKNRQKVKILHNSSDLTLGTWGDVFLVNWKGPVTVDVVRNMGKHLLNFCSSRTKPPGYFAVISKTAVVPGSDAKKELSALMSQVDILVSSVYIEGAVGFRGAATLGIMSALQFVARQPYPNKNFGKLPDAAEWFAKTSSDLGKWILDKDDVTFAVSEFINSSIQ